MSSTYPQNNPAGGERTRSYVGIGYIGWESSYVQSGIGKATFFIPANFVPEDMGGVPLVLGPDHWDPDYPFTYHYGDYVSGPLVFWYDENGYWSDGPNAGYSQFFVIDWGDGSPMEFLGNYYIGAVSHVYATNGTKTPRLLAYVWFPPEGNPWGFDWPDHIPTDYSDTSLFWDVQVVAQYEVECNNGPTYTGYSGPQARCGLSVEEMSEDGYDESFSARAFVMSIPWSDMRMGTTTGDMPATHLSPPISQGEGNEYWPGELFNANAYDGFDVGHNNDLKSDLTTNVDAFSLVSTTPPTGYRAGWSDSDTHYYDFHGDILFGLDGYGRMIIQGRDLSETDTWEQFHVGALTSLGQDPVMKIKYPVDMQLFSQDAQKVPRLRMLYSDTEVLVEVGDGNICVVDFTQVDETGHATNWYLLTNLRQFKVGESFSGNTGQPGRGNGLQRRAGGGAWLLTSRSVSPTDNPHFPVRSIVIGIGRDGVIDLEMKLPYNTWSGATMTTHDPGDFPDAYGSFWEIYSVVGDPLEHNTVYTLTSYLEPYAEYRRTAGNNWRGPTLDEDNTWFHLNRYVSALLRVRTDKSVEPAVWLQHPNWFSTDGMQFPEAVRIMSIYLSSGWWTNSDYTGGQWQGPTKKLPNLTVDDGAIQAYFNPRPHR